MIAALIRFLTGETRREDWKESKDPVKFSPLEVVYLMGGQDLWIVTSTLSPCMTTAGWIHTIRHIESGATCRIHEGRIVSTGNFFDSEISPKSH